MEIGKICPFRGYQNIDGQCESECQLFVSGNSPNEGTCALAALPSIKQALIDLDTTLATLGPDVVGVAE